MKNRSISSCTACSLHTNQKPLLDHERRADVVWVGLSSKKVEDYEVETPLQADTNTGKLVAEIEAQCPSQTFYKTNLVKCLPLNDKGKLRYPSISECSLCYPHLLTEIKEVRPSIVFLLGSKVADFVLKKIGFESPKLSYDYETFFFQGVRYVPIHHPSYISVYRRKEKDVYVRAVKRVIERFIEYPSE